MKISTILDHIDSGHMALPEFQFMGGLRRSEVAALWWADGMMVGVPSPGVRSLITACFGAVAFSARTARVLNRCAKQLSKASLRSVVLFASTFRLYSEDALRKAIDTFRQRVRP